MHEGCQSKSLSATPTLRSLGPSVRVGDGTATDTSPLEMTTRALSSTWNFGTRQMIDELREMWGVEYVRRFPRRERAILFLFGGKLFTAKLPGPGR